MSETISSETIEQMTGYKLPCRQLEYLRERGFIRAYRNRRGDVILERSHYEAVCAGQYGQTKQHQASPNLSFLKKTANG